MQMLILIVPACVAFLVGHKLGKRASGIALAAFAIAFIGLSVYARHEVAKSGLYGWQFYGTGNDWPINVGFALFSACLALTGPAAFRRLRYAIALSAPIVVLFVATVLPVMILACVGFAACV